MVHFLVALQPWVRILMQRLFSGDGKGESLCFEKAGMITIMTVGETVCGGLDEGFT